MQTFALANYRIHPLLATAERGFFCNFERRNYKLKENL